MKSLKAKLASLLILLLVAPVAMAQDTSLSKVSDQQSRLPYEVVVTPNVTFGRLKKLLVQIEDDFFDKFNELNLDDDYDVDCYRFKPTGTHISRRVCEPEFFKDARAENSSDVMFVMSCRCPAAPPPLLNRRGLRAHTGTEFDVMEEKLDAFYRSDAELNAIGSALAEVKLRIKNFSKN